MTIRLTPSGKTRRGQTRKSFGEYLDEKKLSLIGSVQADAVRSAGRKNPSESLADLGLSVSGYRDYLERKKTTDKADALSDLLSDAKKTEAAARAGYGNYLKQYESERENSVKNTVSAIGNEGISDYDEAYAFALDSGLSDRDAAYAAETAVTEAKEKSFKDAVERVAASGFGREKSLALARSLGLDDELASLAVEAAMTKRKNGYSTADELFRTYIDQHKNKKG